MVPPLTAFWVVAVIIRRLITRQIQLKTEINWLFSLALAFLFFGFYSLTWILFTRQFGFTSALNSLLHLFSIGMLAGVLFAIHFKLKVQLVQHGFSIKKSQRWIFTYYTWPFIVLGALVGFFLMIGNVFEAAEIFYSGTTLLWLWGAILLLKQAANPTARQALFSFLASSLVFSVASILYGWQLRFGAYRFGGLVDWLHGLGAFLLLYFVYLYFRLHPVKADNTRYFYRLRYWIPILFGIIALIISYAIYSYIIHESVALFPQITLADIWPRLIFELTLVWVVAAMMSVLIYVLVSKQASLHRLLQSRTLNLRRRVNDLADSKYFLDNVNDGIVVASLAGEIKYANQTSSRLCNRSLKKLKNQNLHRLFLACQSVTFAQARQVCQSQGVWHGEFELAQPSGRRVLSASLHSFGQDPPRLMLVSSDITQRKQIEEDKTQFVAFVAHQLREPLVEMRWLTEQLLTEKINQSTKAHLNMLHESVLHENDFVRQLLDISRLERGILKIEAQPVACVKIVKQAVQPLLAKADQFQVKIIFDSIPQDLQVLTDPNKLVEVLRNLIDNAIKYTRKNSEIRLQAVKRGSAVDFMVCDQGPGIPAELAGKIFEIKGRGDKRHKNSGAGLGLHFSHRLVEAMHGQITFVSSNQGTTFTVSLPAP
ncbi:PAS domain-containing sensor histidine kinase [Patescibacteria group bacterium]|nr:PAS domain-containing sensor histidine kinase [Patescibacteria group bacterium]